MDFDVTGNHGSHTQHASNTSKKKKKRIQSYLQISRKPVFQVEVRSCVILSMSITMKLVGLIKCA